ncbi:hypothetical protein VTN02DRAFT_6251 [Thermoascus thermophilus]
MAGSIRDPAFWRRFSLAIRADEEAKTPGVDKDAVLFSDTWIKRQEKKKRRTRLFGFLIGLSIASFACGVAIVIWYFAKRNWLRGETDSKSG